MSTTEPPPQNQTLVPPDQKAEAAAFLRSLLNKNLRVTTTDNRLFWGGFKCTDSESNLVLEHTYEYRHPTPREISQAAEAAAASSSLPSTAPSSGGAVATGATDSGSAGAGGSAGRVTVDMTSRYLGLVVVPGKYIVRIEVDEFASQLRGRGLGSGALGFADQRGRGIAGDGVGVL